MREKKQNDEFFFGISEWSQSDERARATHLSHDHTDAASRTGAPTTRANDDDDDGVAADDDDEDE